MEIPPPIEAVAHFAFHLVSLYPSRTVLLPQYTHPLFIFAEQCHVSTSIISFEDRYSLLFYL